MLESYIVIAIILSVIYVLSIPFFYRFIKDALNSTNRGSIIIILLLGIMIAFSLEIYIGTLDMIFKTII